VDKNIELGMADKILVTGGAGFIGSNLTKLLLKLNYDVIVIDNYSSGKKSNHVSGAKYIELDTADLNTVIDDINDVNAVFHLAEYSRIVPSFDNITELWKSNLIGSFNVINFCKNMGIKLVYAGSSTKFAEESVNHSPYSFAKYVISELIKNYGEWFGLKYSICYFYNVFGDGYDSSAVPGYESVISVFEKQYKAGKPLTICGDGSQKRSFTYVDDIVKGLIDSYKYEHNIEVQLNNENEYTILEIAKMFKDDVLFIPPRRGDRHLSQTTNNNARQLLKWNTTINVDEWIKRIKIND
jgi:UDP-glucose 4-epimerase